MSTHAIFFCLVTPFFYALNGVLLKKGSSSIPPFASITVSMTVLWALSALMTFLTEKSFSWSYSENKVGFQTLLAVGFVNTAAFWCLLKTYSYVPVWVYQMFALLTPLFSAVLGFFLLGEIFGPKMFVGLGIVGIGLFIAIS
ncbi:MAG: DMT family transporter [Bdellovibrionales bacterium]|nr:DMT family transporter [Bdellovibrionales bacterium]